MTDQQKLNRAFDFFLIDIGRRVLTEDQRFKRFVRTTWGNIQLHTVNGVGKAKANKAAVYLRKGIRVEMTKQEFYTWCEGQRDVILNMFTLHDKPSLDRIDSCGHYSLDNIRIIPFRENCARSGRERGLLTDAKVKALPPKNCQRCGRILFRKYWAQGRESLRVFAQRKTCGLLRDCE